MAGLSGSNFATFLYLFVETSGVTSDEFLHIDGIAGHPSKEWWLIGKFQSHQSSLMISNINISLVYMDPFTLNIFHTVVTLQNMQHMMAGISITFITFS